MSNEIQTDSVKGLLPYEINDPNFYYTNTELVEDFFRQLERNHFIVLSGKIGSGKTSFLNCIFSEKFKKITNVDDTWNIVRIRPGLIPTQSIAFFLSNSNFSADKLSNKFVEETTNLLLSNSNGLSELFDKYKTRKGGRLILVIDPLDDLFLLSSVMTEFKTLTPKQHVDHFINLLCTFEQQCKNLPIYTILSFSNSLPEKTGQYPKFLDIIQRNNFTFPNINIAKTPDLIDNIVPDTVKKINDFPQFITKIKSDLENKSYSDTLEWLFYLQHALKQTIKEWNKNKNSTLYQCYIATGGIKKSIEIHAENIYNKRVSLTDKKFEGIYELILSTLVNFRGDFCPIIYSDIVDICLSYYKEEDKGFIEENIIKPFILLLAENELGIIEIIQSVDEKSRVIALKNKKSIADSDVIRIRNNRLISKWTRIEIIQSSKIKLINEYRWYSRIASSKKNKNKNYPTTLQAYAIADKNRDKSKDPEEFKLIGELLRPHETLEKTLPSKISSSDIIQTQMYIQEGIRYWKDKYSEEEYTRSKNERKTKLRLRYFAVSLFVLVFIALPSHRFLVSEFNDMQSQFDCMTAENLRIISYIDRMQIEKLKEYARCDKVSNTILNNLDGFSKDLKSSLKTNYNNISGPYDDIYTINEFQFALQYFTWVSKRDDFINRNDSIFKATFNSLGSSIILTVDTAATNPKIYEDYKINPDLINDRSKMVYKKWNQPLIFAGITLPPTFKDIPYYLQCKECSQSNEKKEWDEWEKKQKQFSIYIH